MEEMSSGAVRSSMFSKTVDSKFPPRYDLLPMEGLRRWAEAFGEGSEKYGDDNFRKGMEDRCLLQHALNHLFLYQAGDKNEDHLGHAMWNIGMLCKMEKERPDLMVLQQQIAKEYDMRERPIYATDDPRLSQPMGMQAPVEPLTYERAVELLKKAADTFLRYSEIHNAKQTNEGVLKGMQNYEQAQEILKALGH